MAPVVQLTRTHRILIGIIVVGATVIAAIGFVGSYAAVRELAERKGFGDFAPFVPIGIDAGIVVLLALDLLLTWMRIPFPLLRQTAWLLTAATVAFNGAAAWGDPLAVGMHAIIPVLFIITVEAARHAVGRITAVAADKHMEGVRLWRWVLSPFPTFRLWRRMKLWELRSYQEVIDLERDRLVYRARLRARYGRAWRRRAPVEARLPLKLAHLGVPLDPDAPAIEPAPVAVAAPAGGGPALGPGRTAAGAAVNRLWKDRNPAADIGGGHGTLAGGVAAAPLAAAAVGAEPGTATAREPGHQELAADPLPHLAPRAERPVGDAAPGHDRVDDRPDEAVEPLPDFAAVDAPYTHPLAGPYDPPGVEPFTDPPADTVPGSAGRRDLRAPLERPTRGDEPAQPADGDAPVGLPAGVEPGEFYYRAYRELLGSYDGSTPPNARHLARHLFDAHQVGTADGNMLSERYLLPYVRECRERHRTEVGVA